MSYAMVSQLAEDGSIYQGKILGSKFVHAVHEGVAGHVKGDGQLVRSLGDMIQHVALVHGRVLRRQSRTVVVGCFRDGPPANINQVIRSLHQRFPELSSDYSRRHLRVRQISGNDVGGRRV